MKMRITLDEHAIMPTRAHDTDAGLDIMTPLDFFLSGRSSIVVHTGVHVELPAGTVGILKSKSGLSTKKNIQTIDGVIDEGYTGEIVVKLHNAGNTPFILYKGDKITQLVIVPCFAPEL